MMKKSLVKMRVCLGFDCNPRLDVITYEDEVTEDGRAYQSTRGIRNEKTLVGIGLPWLKYDSLSKEPYWDAYVILESTATEEERSKVVAGLYESAIGAMRKGVDEFNGRFGSIAVPSLPDISKMLSDKLNGASGISAGGIVVPVEKFKSLIAENVKSSGLELASTHGFGAEKWNEFYERTLTPDILTVLMKGLPVLKINGDGIAFQTEEMYRQALVAVAGKVTSDVFARFVEEQTSALKPSEA
jgi:hypothetical protein